MSRAGRSMCTVTEAYRQKVASLQETRNKRHTLTLYFAACSHTGYGNCSLTPRQLGATQGDSTHAATGATPRRTPGRHAAARALHAPQLSTLARCRAAIPALRSSRSAGVLRGGQGAAGAPGAHGRRSVLALRLAARCSASRARRGWDLCCALRPRRDPALRPPIMWTSGALCMQPCSPWSGGRPEAGWWWRIAEARVHFCGCAGGHVPAAWTHHRTRGCAGFATAGSLDCRSRSARARSWRGLAPSTRQAATTSRAPSASRRPASARRMAARSRVRGEEPAMHCPAFCRSLTAHAAASASL